MRSISVKQLAPHLTSPRGVTDSADRQARRGLLRGRLTVHSGLARPPLGPHPRSLKQTCEAFLTLDSNNRDCHFWTCLRVRERVAKDLY